MRTTLTLDDDVAAAVKELRQREGIGLSEAVNRLARAGLAQPAKRQPYRHQAFDMGIKVDITNIGDVLALLDEDDAGCRQRAITPWPFSRNWSSGTTSLPTL